MANCIFLLVILLIVLPEISSTAPVGRGTTIGRGATTGRGGSGGGGGYSGGSWTSVFVGFFSGYIFGAARPAPRTNWGTGDYWEGKIPSAHMAAVNPQSESSESDWHVVPEDESKTF